MCTVRYSEKNDSWRLVEPRPCAQVVTLRACYNYIIAIRLSLSLSRVHARVSVRERERRVISETVIQRHFSSPPSEQPQRRAADISFHEAKHKLWNNNF